MKSIKIVGIAAPLLMVAVLVLGTACGTRGLQGEDGVGIHNISNNGDGTFTVNLTNGEAYTTDDLTGPQGIHGLQGMQGEPGLPGVGIAWQGEWSGMLMYSRHDAVGYQGSSYVSRQDNNINHVPTDTNWWDLWIEKGETGAAGAPGPNMVVAIGNIQSDGTIVQGYNVTGATWNIDQLRYEITLTGINYAPSNYVTLVTLIYGSPAHTAETYYSQGQLVVYIYDIGGNAVQGYFNFMVLDPAMA